MWYGLGQGVAVETRVNSFRNVQLDGQWYVWLALSPHKWGGQCREEVPTARPTLPRMLSSACLLEGSQVLHAHQSTLKLSAHCFSDVVYNTEQHVRVFESLLRAGAWGEPLPTHMMESQGKSVTPILRLPTGPWVCLYSRPANYLNCVKGSGKVLKINMTNSLRVHAR